MPVIIPAAASAASGLISGITGMVQKHKGNKLLKSLQYPTEKMPSAIEGMENEGLPQEQYDRAMRNIQRQQMQALSGANDRRGGLATIGNLVAGTNDATLDLDSRDAEARQNNRRYVAGIQRDLFDKNVRSKYNRDYDYAMSLIGAGNQNFTSGLDKLVAGGGAYANGQNQNGSYGYGGGTARIKNSPLTYYPQ